jgi:hypothetical protein
MNGVSFFRRFLPVLCCWLAAAAPVAAQGWQRAFADLKYPRAVVPTADGGACFVADRLPSAPGADETVAVVKTDAQGRWQWERRLGGAGDDQVGHLAPAADGDGVVLAGTYAADATTRVAWFARLDASGTVAWQKTYSFAGFLAARSIRPAAGGSGYVAAVETTLGAQLLRLDADGNLLAAYELPATAGLQVHDLEATRDTGFLLTLLTPPSPLVLPTAYVLKATSSGQTEFLHGFSSNSGDPGSVNTTARTKVLDDSSFILIHRDSVYYLDLAGQRRQGLAVGVPDDPAATLTLTDVLPDPCGDGFYALGTSTTLLPTLRSGIFLARFSHDGTPLWIRSQRAPSNYHRSWALAPATNGCGTADGGVLATGHYAVGGELSSYLLRTDSLGLALTNTIEGTVYWDQNGSCTQTGAEPPLAGWIVRIEHPNGAEYFATTDSNGHFATPAGLGDYTVQVHLPNAVWQTTCAAVLVANFDTVFQTATLAFAVEAAEACALPWVDVAVPAWEPCVPATVVVRYANRGAAAAAPAAVELTLDPALVVSQASLPYTVTGGGAYRFALGTLPALSQGEFTVECVPDCGLPVLGQALCLDAVIEPDTTCLAAAAGPLLEVRGICTGDSVRFEITNRGSGMTVPASYIVIEDNIMEYNGLLQLGSGASEHYDFPATGATWRFQAQQAPGAPAWLSDDLIAAAVEGCAVGSAYSTGVLNQYSLYDGGTFEETECPLLGAAAAGTEKRAVPTGFGPAHGIEPDTDLEYLLQFRNTSGDTVVSVALVDTLAALWLDPASVEPGPASHPYHVELGAQGVLTFAFDSIFLPDAAVDPAGSFGWVKFRVAQRPGLAPGTVIENRAGVYFDYAASQPTNTVWHTVVEPLITALPPAPPPGAPTALSVQPVPAFADVVLEMARPGSYTAELHDATGRCVLRRGFTGATLVLPERTLPAGLYWASIREAGRRVAGGKVIILR